MSLQQAKTVDSIPETLWRCAGQRAGDAADGSQKDANVESGAGIHTFIGYQESENREHGQQGHEHNHMQSCQSISLVSQSVSGTASASRLGSCAGSAPSSPTGRRASGAAPRPA